MIPNSAAHSHEFIHYDSRVAYYSRGQSAGITFVFVHGNGGSAALFQPLMERLGDNFRLLAIDLPGFGASERPAHLYTIEGYADALETLLTREHIFHPILVGHGMGCQVIASLLAAKPALAAKAVFIGPTLAKRQRRLEKHLHALATDAIREPLRSHLTVWREFFRGGIGNYLHAYDAMCSERLEEDLAGLEAAVLIMRGTYDTVSPHPWSGKLAAVATAAGLFEVKGAAHHVHLTHPQEVADICEGFALT